MSVVSSIARRSRLPDFVIGGAPRSGTTWLYTVLSRHPRLWLAKPVRPEPKFFLVDAEYSKGLDYYKQRWFSDVPENVIAGEKSTNYLESRNAATRLANDIPQARLIFMLREPASRAFSNYRFTRMNGLEHLDFAAALAEEGSREQSYEERFRFSRPYSYFTRGLYARQLEPWLELFPREQVLIKRYEDLLVSPSSVLTDVHRFLGVEPRPADLEGIGIVNATDGAGIDDSMLASLRGRYAEPNRHLYSLLGTELWSTHAS